MDYRIYYIFILYVDTYIISFIFTISMTSTQVYTLPYTTTVHLWIL